MEVIKKLNKGTLLRNASGQLTYEINDYWHEQYKPAKKKISKHFGLLPLGITINGSGEAFQTFFRGRKRIGIEWDVWSGLIIVAKNEKSEDLVHRISEFCENNEI